MRRSPLGLRGLKLKASLFAVKAAGRSPLGLRGLKSVMTRELIRLLEVAAHSGCVD